MLTPVDIEQKKFKTGIGYEKKDVNQFFEEVSKSYGELYRSNAEMKERVMTLTDKVQHYKTTESELQKTLMLADKSVEESKSNAEKTAKNIENEAKSRANEIVKDARAELEEIKAEIEELRSRYAEYKSAFALLVKKQAEILEINDFDADAYIAEGYMVAAAPADSYGGFGGDPQMRESTLGSAASISASREQNRSSSANVYGSTLGGDGIDPFKAIKKS